MPHPLKGWGLLYCPSLALYGLVSNFEYMA
jgi:hypothetical protein